MSMSLRNLTTNDVGGNSLVTTAAATLVVSPAASAAAFDGNESHLAHHEVLGVVEEPNGTGGIGVGGIAVVTSGGMPQFLSSTSNIGITNVVVTAAAAVPADGTATTFTAAPVGIGGIGIASNDNNNNMDNSSDEMNPVTIYRCRAPIASLDCMEEFSGTGGHLDFGIKFLTISVNKNLL